MATKIRLQRHGAKKRPFYQVVIADERSRRDGRFIENVGYYDPTKNPAILKLNVEKVIDWLGKGAQPTDTVNQILKKEGILEKAAVKVA
jgi:small subunit ribosomal protein S16